MKFGGAEVSGKAGWTACF